jgi:hypothetical protein
MARRRRPCATWAVGVCALFLSYFCIVYPRGMTPDGLGVTADEGVSPGAGVQTDWAGDGTRMFFLAGVEKCGTTSLYAHLASHPLVAPAHMKELRVFDTPCDDGRDAATLDSNAKDAVIAARREWWKRHYGWTGPPDRHAYLRLFPTAASLFARFPLAVAGEATPSYVFDACALPRMLQWFPRAKLIVVIREPVERAVSFWSMLRRDGETFEEFLGVELQALSSSSILDQLRSGDVWRWPQRDLLSWWTAAVANMSSAVREAERAQNASTLGATLGLTILKGYVLSPPSLYPSLSLSPSIPLSLAPSLPLSLSPSLPLSLSPSLTHTLSLLLSPRHPRCPLHFHVFG